MIHNCKVLAGALCAILGLASTSTNANAACATLAGTWHIFTESGKSPNLKVVGTPIVTNLAQGGDKTVLFTIKNFNVLATPQVSNDTTTILQCTLHVAADGTISTVKGSPLSPCTAYHVPTGVSSFNVKGQLTLSTACGLTGSITSPGVPVVTIRGGQINGNTGAGIATQNNGNNSLFSIVKG
ncbi:MAG: hypothetical protein WBD48_05100 [Pseudolabrys sp.]